MQNQMTTSAANDVTEAFAGLPLGLLVCQPILEVAKGQLALCRVYIDQLLELAYVDPSDTSKGTRTISFTFDRLIIDKVTGKETTKTMTLNVPLISLVPNDSSSSLSATESFNFWGCSASITGNVSANNSHTRSTDSTAKYTIHARAVQQPPTEGMAKLTSLFASSIEPYEKTQ